MNAFHLKVSSSARQFHKRHSCPTFILGSQGELLQVAFNNQVDVFFIMVTACDHDRVDGDGGYNNGTTKKVRSSELSGDAVETKNLLR